MATSIRTAEQISKLTKASATTLTYPASRTNVGPYQYVNASPITLSTGTVGFNGVDATLQNSTLYYVYAVVQSGNLGMCASTSSTGPAGFSQSRMLGLFLTDAVGAMYSVLNTDRAIGSYTKSTKQIDITSYVTSDFTNWVCNSAYAQFFTDSLGVWNVKLDITGNGSQSKATNTFITHTVPGVNFAHISSNTYYSPLAVLMTAGSTVVAAQGYTSDNSNCLYVQNCSGSTYTATRANVNGIVRLTGEPTWASLGVTGASVMENINFT